MAKKRLSRRKFMKIGISCMAGAAMHVKVLPESPADKKRMGVSRTSLKALRAIPTTCEQCPAGCGIIAYLNGERLVQILGNPDHPINVGGICSKGIAGINLVNDAERLLYPMKRLGPRGSNRWTQITWDEAAHMISERFIYLIKQNRSDEMVIDMGRSDPILDLFIQGLGLKNVIDRPNSKNINRNSAFKEMTESELLIEDVGRSRFILNFGANPLAHHDFYVGMARRIMLSRIEEGAKLFTFDVRMSETAAKSDQWFPIRAGTDGLVALSIAHVLVEKGLVNTEFIEQKTKLSFSVLKNHLSSYTPQRAEKESGIKSQKIIHLAEMFANEKPSVAIIGGGATDHQNGYLTTKCISLLNWLVGNLEIEGGLRFPRYPAFPVEREKLHAIQGIRELTDSGIPVDTYFAYLSNPAYSDPDCEQTALTLKDTASIPFLVVMDTHLTETAMLADIVLPAATYLEGWSLFLAPPLDGVPILNFRQPVVSLVSPAEALRSPSFDVGKLLESSFHPQGEAKEIGNLCLELAKKIGGNLLFNLPYKNTQDFVTKTIKDLTDQRVSIKDLKTEGLWIDATPSTPPRAGRLKTFSLPDYQPFRGSEEKRPGQFILTPFKSNLWARGTENSKWTREISHQNSLWMNKVAASRLGIKNGDRVRVSSSVGSLIVPVLTTNLIHPDSVAIAEGFGHTAVGKVAQAQKFKSTDRDTQLIWWHKKGKGVNPYEIIESRKDPIGGGQTSKDTLVRIQKIEE